MTPQPYPDALAAVRDVLAFHAPQPGYLPRSLELEDKVRAAAHAALHARLALPALATELGRLAAETIPADPAAATATGQAMARWATQEYYAALGLDIDEGAP